MMAGRFLTNMLAACTAITLLVGCRERHVPETPAVITTDIRMIQPPVPASTLGPGRLQEARPSPDLCSFDSVDSQYFQGTLNVDRSRPIRLRGWLGVPGPRPASEFQLILSSESATLFVPARTGVPRPDVAEYFSVPAMGTAGFEVLADLASVPTGTYSVLLLADDQGGAIVCDTEKRMRLE